MEQDWLDGQQGRPKGTRWLEKPLNNFLPNFLDPERKEVINGQDPLSTFPEGEKKFPVSYLP